MTPKEIVHRFIDEAVNGGRRLVHFAGSRGALSTEVSATVSEAVAKAFENAKDLPEEVSSVTTRDIAGARYVPPSDARVVERIRLQPGYDHLVGDRLAEALVRSSRSG